MLEVSSLPVSAVYAFGGHSRSGEEIARQAYGGDPTPAELQAFEVLLAKSNSPLGPRWITGHAKDRVSAKMLQTVERLRPFKS